MSVCGGRIRRRLARGLVFALTCGSLPAATHAGAWIAPPGTGWIDLMVRRFDATRVFLPDRYSTRTLPGSQLRYTMVRMTGEQGLGGNLSIQYDLRAARVEKIRTHHGRRSVAASSGAQDQEIGLNYQLTRRAGFADSIALNVVAATGSVNTAPALGVGHTAIEPDFQLGLAARRWRTSLTAGSRIFVDGAAAQMRAELDASARLSRRLELGFVLFYVRTLTLHSTLAPADRSERYDLLRPGLRLKLRVSNRFKPFIEYEQAVAGQAIHAGRRVTLGVTYSY